MKKLVCSWESPFANCLSRALPVSDYLSRAIVDCGEHPLRTLRSWVSPPADGSRSPERSHIGDGARNRHYAVCRVGVERAAYTDICDQPLTPQPRAMGPRTSAHVHRCRSTAVPNARER